MYKMTKYLFLRFDNQSLLSSLAYLLFHWREEIVNMNLIRQLYFESLNTNITHIINNKFNHIRSTAANLKRCSNIHSGSHPSFQTYNLFSLTSTQAPVDRTTLSLQASIYMICLTHTKSLQLEISWNLWIFAHLWAELQQERILSLMNIVPSYFCFCQNHCNNNLI